MKKQHATHTFRGRNAPSSARELCLMSAVDLARAIREGDVSSEEVVRAHLERIEAVNPRLNALVRTRPEAALEEARVADADRARGKVRGPLRGVPFTIKDSLDTAGVITTAGTRGRASFVPARDATVVARLRKAGAILLGKTNVPELTLAFETDNGVCGRTDNPWDPGRTAGGSSGGAAAIVAAGGSPFDIGSDTGGSIRQPAHFCGVAGLKPTFGRVPRTGHVVAFDGLLGRLTQLGPLARSVGDLALILSVITGVDWRDPDVVPMPFGDPTGLDLRGLRVAMFTENGIANPTDETVETVRRAARALAEAGAHIEETDPPGIGAAEAIYAGFFLDGGAWLEHLLGIVGTEEPHEWIVQTLEWQRANQVVLAEFSGHFRRWTEFRARMTRFMESYDLLLCPVNGLPAIPHGTTVEHLAQFSYTKPFNLTGWPAVAVPFGFSPEGLPIGVQLAAAPWREDLVLAAALCLEPVFTDRRNPPI